MAEKLTYYRQCVSISAALKKRMEKIADQVNWSSVAARAFEAKLEEMGEDKPIAKRLQEEVARIQKELDAIKDKLRSL